MRRAIVNADDFGLSPGVNRGILRCFREGILSSATMLANLDFFDDAVGLARDNPDLPLGVHLSLLWGRPVLDPAAVPSLVGRDGCFPDGLGTLAGRYFTRRLRLDEVRAEFRAQVRKFMDAGLTPTHFDTHKHVHCLPGVLRAMIDVAGEVGVDRLRLPVESPLAAGAPRGGVGWKSRGKKDIIRWFCRSHGKMMRSAGLKTTDYFVGITQMERLNTDSLQGILTHLREGVTEIMCHPGAVDPQSRRYGGVPPHREVEMEALCSARVRDTVAARSIELIDYGRL